MQFVLSTPKKILNWKCPVYSTRCIPNTYISHNVLTSTLVQTIQYLSLSLLSYSLRLIWDCHLRIHLTYILKQQLTPSSTIRNIHFFLEVQITFCQEYSFLVFFPAHICCSISHLWLTIKVARWHRCIEIDRWTRISLPFFSGSYSVWGHPSLSVGAAMIQLPSASPAIGVCSTA